MLAVSVSEATSVLSGKPTSPEIVIVAVRARRAVAGMFELIIDSKSYFRVSSDRTGFHRNGGAQGL